MPLYNTQNNHPFNENKQCNIDSEYKPQYYEFPHSSVSFAPDDLRQLEFPFVADLESQAIGTYCYDCGNVFYPNQRRNYYEDGHARCWSECNFN